MSLRTVGGGGGVNILALRFGYVSLLSAHVGVIQPQCAGFCEPGVIQAHISYAVVEDLWFRV